MSLVTELAQQVFERLPVAWLQVAQEIHRIAMNAMPTLTGPYWPEPVSVLSTSSTDGFVAIEAYGLNTCRHYSTTLPAEAWEALQPAAEWQPTFDANAQHFRLAIEAERLRLAYTCDPLLATNNAVIDLVPHQLEAVYDIMLPQPRIRHLMAHDAGAGKTAMCGLLYKELSVRQPALHTLIVAPAALVPQWEREMETKFLERFEPIGRDEVRGNGNVWAETRQAITSVSFASQEDIRASLANIPWDLVIVDEAHHMAGYKGYETQAYQLGRVLSRTSRHMVLATATPHKGDPENFLKLLQLLDTGIHDPAIVHADAAGARGTPLMLRRLKEEMVGFDGQPLFKPRVVETRWHTIEQNPPEHALYAALTDYVAKTYRAAEKIGGQTKVNVRFAMAILQRRMGSSFYALEQSLLRRRKTLEAAQATAEIPSMVAIPEDAPEHERWKAESSAETATPARTRKEREKEIAEIDRLLGMLGAVRATGFETKVAKLGEILAEAGVAPGNGEKLLVFTESKDTLDFLRSQFEGWGYSVTQIDGNMDPHERRGREREFELKCQVMVATEAAGEGINLQFCARMVNYDLPWVPTRLEQRMGRIHRYGQKRVARVYNLLAGDTREGYVLKGLLDRLDTMRQHMGDQVFDVVSALVTDVDMENLLTKVALAPATEPSQVEVLECIVAATQEGEKRLQAWQEHPYPLDLSRYERLRDASRQFRLTPEYAQHFFVDVLEAMKEMPHSISKEVKEPGDAPAFSMEVLRQAVAERLRVHRGDRVTFTFRPEVAKDNPRARLVTLGSEVFDGLLCLAGDEWGETLFQGAVFLDPDLPPGDGYLAWFVRACVVDGNAQPVTDALLAVRQTPTALDSLPSSQLINLMPTNESPELPSWMEGLARDPRVALDWSAERQQLSLLAEAGQQRRQAVDLRRRPMLADARQALQAARTCYDESVFGGQDNQGEAERMVHRAEMRVREMETLFAREEACSLVRPEIVGVAAVLSVIPAPEKDLRDTSKEAAAKAEALAQEYEEKQGRTVKNVTGEHQQFPYDLHSSGPGGIRCIEVKDVTSGSFFLSENERRAAQRLGASYYLYIVTDPLGTPRLTIVRDPLSKMQYDGTLYGGVRYLYNKSTWQAAQEQEIAL